MKVNGIIWLRNVIDKLLWKHNVTTDEVEEVFDQTPRYRYIESGDVEGEDLYAAMGQTGAGRYLTVYFVRKLTSEALIVSGRDMTKKERRSYGKKAMAPFRMDIHSSTRLFATFKIKSRIIAADHSKMNI